MLDISVIICSHNPRVDYLQRVLAALQSQTYDPDRWELLLVDNGSDTPLSTTWDLSWQPHARHIQEPEIGVALARQRGIRESLSNVIVFVDDDNVLERDYLTRAMAIEREWPFLGAWGSGATAPEFESLPPPHLKKFLPFLAIRDFQKPRWSNVFPCGEATPAGAGMCVRKRIGMAYCKYYEQSSLKLASRQGKSSLMGHEDYEICFIACREGLGMGVFPQLRLTHLIPKARLSEDYVAQLLEAGRTSSLLLTFKTEGWVPPPPNSFVGLLGLIRNVAVLRGFDRRLYLGKRRAISTARRLIAESTGTT